MLITDKKDLEKFASAHRPWQGIPGIERTRGGRTFLTFYSGGISEQSGNFAVVIKSDTDTDFGEPIAAAFKEGEFRCFDTCLWIDPLSRLWFIWNVSPGEECFGAICDDPDADELVWGEEFYIGRGVMLNKPTVLSSGEWLFPIALWKFSIRPYIRMPYIKEGEVSASYVYSTTDNGKTFTRLGGSQLEERNFDEHSIVELSDGRLMMTVRTDYGTGISYSSDRGVSWSEGVPSDFGPTASRIHIRKLRSGRILRISHAIIEKILELKDGERFLVLAPVVRAQKGMHEKVLASAKKSGYVRVRIDGNVYELSEEITLDKNKKHNIDVIVDRLVMKEGIRSRLADSVENALKIADGHLIIATVPRGDEKGEELEFSQSYACEKHNISFGELEPRMFSFNNPQGACPHCDGIGDMRRLAVDRLIPDKKLSLRQGAIAVNGFKSLEEESWNGPLFMAVG